MFKSILVVVALSLVLGLSSVFVVSEGERGMVLELGKARRDAEDKLVVYSPGIHFKRPLLDEVLILDARLQTLSSEESRYVTSEKKDVIIDSYVKWRIGDFDKFFLATNRGTNATRLLAARINNALRSQIGTRTIVDLVSGERGEVMETALLRSAAAASAELGIEVMDVRIKTINLPGDVSESIYNRMRAEREAAARQHRSEGQKDADVIRANVDARVRVELAQARQQGAAKRAEGDAKAARIYSDAYERNPEFYSFLRSLDAYRSSFAAGQDVMVLDPNNEFFQYMKSSKAQ